ncbi:ATP-binding protein, partial [Mycolicibacterium fortuitum]|uniref:ATP-binding protein n=1 Tax=Mycolicibacterium fortuitum TaxID=1766 RepID=UPI000A80ACF5
MTTTPEDLDNEPEDEKPGRRSVAAQLVEMARDNYKLGISDTEEAYGVREDRPHIALSLRSGKTGLRAELSRRFFTENSLVPSQQALADALTVLEGYAAEEPPRRVNLRVGEHAGKVYIDVGDSDGTVVQIANGRWSVVDTAPVLFRRTRLTGQLDLPYNGERASEKLWEFVRVDPADRPVLLAWLVAVLILVDAPHPILALLAEQGAAKSSITRCLVDLVDPSSVPLRKAPRDEDSWVIAAAASWVVALDNLSGSLQQWLSDCLCRASTGDGSVRRALYTDSDVSVISFRRCVIFNGVDVTVEAGDLAERIAAADLARIEEGARRAEADIAAAWEHARPAIMGSLLDLAAQVHQLLPTVKVDNLPRMADFALVLAAVDQVLGTSGLERYRDRARKIAADTLVHPFTAAVVAYGAPLMRKTSNEILSAVKPTDPGWKQPRDWPRNARSATQRLTRDAPALRAQGWQIDHDDGANKDKVTRWIIVPPERVCNPAPPDPLTRRCRSTAQNWRVGGFLLTR